MVSKSELLSAFSSLGINLKDDATDLCCGICERQGISADELVETWIAYSMSRLEGAEPTFAFLLDMEKSEFKKQEYSTPGRAKSRAQNAITPSRSRKEKASTQATELNLTPTFREASSPSVNGFESGSVQANSKHAPGTAVHSFNVSLASWSSKPSEKVPITLDIGPYIEPANPPNLWKYFYEPLVSMKRIRWLAVDELCEQILIKNELKIPINASISCSDYSLITGYIICDDNGRLAKDRIQIQGCGAFEAKVMTVDMTDITEASLFPGQVVCLYAKDCGSSLVASKIFCDACLPPPLTTPKCSRPLQIFIASGPFTYADNLGYEPLQQLIDYMANNLIPDVLILTGPILDSSNSSISGGLQTDSFNSFYETVISNFRLAFSGGSEFEIIVVASSKDANNTPMYPTSPATIKSGLTGWPRVRMVADPSLLNINGLVVGMTSTDVLMHLVRKELGWKEFNSGANRLTKLAAHLIQQQSFYPLYPSDPEVSLDLSLWADHARLPVTPHILILPSDLQYFIKEVEGCLVVNPSRAIKGKISGTFTWLEVRPDDESDPWSIDTHMSGKVIKL